MSSWYPFLLRVQEPAGGLTIPPVGRALRDLERDLWWFPVDPPSRTEVLCRVVFLGPPPPSLATDLQRSMKLMGLRAVVLLQPERKWDEVPDRTFLFMPGG